MSVAPLRTPCRLHLVASLGAVVVLPASILASAALPPGQTESFYLVAWIQGTAILSAIGAAVVSIFALHLLVGSRNPRRWALMASCVQAWWLTPVVLAWSGARIVIACYGVNRTGLMAPPIVGWEPFLKSATDPAVLAVSVCIATVLAVRKYSADLHRIRAAMGLRRECPHCGYDMLGLKSSICPECGHASMSDSQWDADSFGR